MLTMEPLETKKLSPGEWRVCRTLVAYFFHFYQQEDPDPQPWIRGTYRIYQRTEGIAWHTILPAKKHLVRF
jgi:hypothetical protein